MQEGQINNLNRKQVSLDPFLNLWNHFLIWFQKNQVIECIHSILITISPFKKYKFI